MTPTFDPETHFTPDEYARINQPRLDREAAKARAAAKRAAARGDSPERQKFLTALADEATQEEQRNRARFEEPTADRKEGAS